MNTKTTYFKLTQGPHNHLQKARKKRKCQQTVGAPKKCAELRDALFTWFAQLRRRVKGRLPLIFLKNKAVALRKEALLAAVRDNRRIHIPIIDGQWLRKWRKEYKVSLRKPQRRFKVPKFVFIERCRITWSNVYRARLLVFHLYGYWPEVDGMDQTPFHFNESGSKEKCTLDFAGDPDVCLKETVGSTRARWSGTTYTTTDPDFFFPGQTPPLEFMFKGGEGVLKECVDMLDWLRAREPGQAMLNVTVGTSDSGSYALPEVLQYLRRHLRPWGPERRWRILLLDAYKPHLCSEVRELCFSRGYLVIFIGGGCTCTLQINDTHIHHLLSRSYQNLEMTWIAEQMNEDPKSLPSPKRVHCMDMLWQSYKDRHIHQTGAKGYRDHLYTLPLDGSEDHESAYNSYKVFVAADMHRHRALIVRDMQDDKDAGRLKMTFRCFQSLIEEFPKRKHLDVLVDGQDDGDLDPEDDDAEPWDDMAGHGSDEDDNVDDTQCMGDEKAQECHALADRTGNQQESKAPVLHASTDRTDLAAPDDSKAKQESYAVVAAAKQKVEVLNDMLQKAEDLHNPMVVRSLMHARAQLRRQAWGANRCADHRTADALRQALDEEEKVRERAQQRREHARRESAAMKDAKAALAVTQKAVAEKAYEVMRNARNQKRIDDCQNAALAFDNQDFMESIRGQQTAKKNRWSAFQRVLLLCDTLPSNRIVSMHGDYDTWERARHSVYKTEATFINYFRRTLVQLLSSIEAGRPREVSNWWEGQHAKIIGKAEVVIPALRR